MNPAFEIKQLLGQDLKLDLDQFYAENGSKSQARPDDVFFIAFSGKKIIGCVRYCVDEGVPMLRTMRIAERFKRKGIGTQLLLVFKKYLETNGISNVFCLPYPHLVPFYGLIGFETVADNEVPKFLIERSQTYKDNGTVTIFMRRK